MEWSLPVIRDKLESKEESIIFALIERSKYKHNSKVYDAKINLRKDYTGSYLDFFLHKTEDLHAQLGRYAHTHQRRFCEGERYVEDKKRELNSNAKIKKAYINFLPQLCEEGDDHEYGSTALIDITALQHISERVHLGMQVASIKLGQTVGQYKEYTDLISQLNIEGLHAKLRDEAVELKILQRVHQKAEKYGMKNPLIIRNLYEETIMPLTREIQAEWFMQKYPMMKHPETSHQSIY